MIEEEVQQLVKNERYSLVRGTDGIRTLRPDRLMIGGTLGVDGEWDKGWPCGDKYTLLNEYDLML